ncbi:MAG TPA: hypothetical protein PK395_17545, partial [bacterium]|nr:hypothetical protein [bacterium]
IQDSGRPLVTGIDLDKVFSRYVADYDRFERGSMGPFSFGMIWRWRVKPLPDDPETKFYWGSKRNDPYYRRFIRLDGGVFSSHGQALLAADRRLTHQQASVPIDPLNPNDPGFVSWGDGAYFVRDNVFYCLQISSEFNTAQMLERFHTDLLNGAEGITKGLEVPVPIIEGDAFPSDMTLFAIGGKPMAPLTVKDPNGRPVYRDVWDEDSDSRAIQRIMSKEKGGPGGPSRIPSSIRWDDSNMVVVDNPGNATVVDLAAVAMNDRCLVSDIWTKRVRIAPPKEIQPQE